MNYIGRSKGPSGIRGTEWDGDVGVGQWAECLKAAVPKLFGTRDQFHGRQFFSGQVGGRGRQGRWFRR